MYKFFPNQIIRRCVPDGEQQDILQMYHEEACEDHFALRKTSKKILLSGFYRPTMFKDFNTLQKLPIMSTTRENQHKVSNATKSYLCH